MNATGHSIVDGDGNWNWNLFGNPLPCNILLMIAAAKSPDINDGQDQVFWGWSKDGRFSFSLVYKYLMGFDIFDLAKIWSMDWKWVGPQRI